MAEREGFEPSMGVTPYTLSRRAPSTARTPLRKWWQPKPATLRRSSSLLPLLPSGPDGVHNVSSRRDRSGSPLRGAMLPEWGTGE